MNIPTVATPNIMNKFSCAQAVTRTCDKICDILIHQLPRLCTIGENLVGLEKCKTHLHDTFFLSKGGTRIKIDSFKSKLQDL